MKCGRCSELVHGPKNDAVCCQDDARSARVESSLSQWLAINAAYVRTLACVGTQLKDCGNELQLLLPLVPVLLPPTHCVALAAGVHLVACSAASSCIRYGQMHYNYNIFKVWQAAGAIDNAAAHIPFVNQRAAAAAQWDHGAYEECAMCTTCVVRQSTHSLTHLPVHKGHFRCELHKVSSSLVALPAPTPVSCPHLTLYFDHFAVRCFQEENLFCGCSSVIFNENST